MDNDDDDDDDIDDNLEANKDDDDDDDSVSDFDDDEDPDAIEIPVAPDLAAASASTFNVKPSAPSVPSVQQKPAAKVVLPKSVYTNGKPMLSTLGLPILPVNTATTRIGGPVVARRGGLAGQPFTSEYTYSFNYYAELP